MTAIPRTLGPNDFDPYRPQIHDCHCHLCRVSGVVGRSNSERQRDAAALLGALQAGTHTRVELADHIAAAKREHAAKVAQACAAGATDYQMYCMTLRHYDGREFERFYQLTSGGMSLSFQVGTGLGMTPGRHAAAMKSVDGQVDRRNAQLAAAVPGLVAADPRNACVHFRQTGQLCDHHASDTADAPPPVPAQSAPFVSSWAAVLVAQ